MASEITQQQRAEAMLRTIGCYPWPYRVELLLEYAITARQEALREALRIAKEDGNITAVREQLDRLAREAQINCVMPRN